MLLRVLKKLNKDHVDTAQENKIKVTEKVILHTGFGELITKIKYRVYRNIIQGYVL